jgi:hypothetical protein
MRLPTAHPVIGTQLRDCSLPFARVVRGQPDRLTYRGNP